MNELKSENVAINLPLLKLFGLHRILDPNRSISVFNVFDSNVYGLSSIAITFITLVICLVTLLSMFAEMINDVIVDLELMQLLMFYTLYIRLILVIYMLVFNAKNVRNSFDVTRIDFLSARNCRNFVRVIWKYRHDSYMISNFFFVSLYTVVTIWCIFPFVFTSFSSDAAYHRKENIFNLRFPVTVYVYNEYYSIFYMIEMFLTHYGTYFLSLFIIYFQSICYVFIAQYEVIALAYEDVGHVRGCDAMQIEVAHHENDYYDDFKAILIDHQRLDLKLKLYYSIIWNCIIISVVSHSTGFIYMTYSFIVIFMSSELFSIFSIIKLLFSLSYFIIELFIICYLLERINTKKEAAESAIYNCNWTDKSLMFKKNMLLAMRMHNTNELIIKITPIKIVNFQLFASVVSTSYNIISIMLKTRSNRSN